MKKNMNILLKLSHTRLGSYIYKQSFLASFLQWCVRLSFLLKTKLIAATEYCKSIPRQFGYKDKRFETLRNLKGKFLGKRCFVLCTGPSLTISDLELLENEYTFGMNSICMIHDKTKWKPDFFGIQDVFVFEKLKDTILSTDNGLVFTPYGYKKRFHTPDDWVYFHMCGAYHLNLMDDTKCFTHISGNAYARVYDGYSIAITIIQLAMYMGFKELYLLGADCGSSSNKTHFIDHGHPGTPMDELQKRLFVSYEATKKFAEAHGVQIFNATRGGYLEVFQRVVLEDVLSNNSNNKIAD